MRKHDSKEQKERDVMGRLVVLLSLILVLIVGFGSRTGAVPRRAWF